jgi:hypothetical protein
MAATAEAPAASLPGVWRGSAFGLEIESPLSLTGVASARPGGDARKLTLRHAEARELERGWRPEGTETLLDFRFPDGRPMMRVEGHPERGFLIWAPRHGRYLVAPGGRDVRMAIPRTGSWRWQRLLFAQVLPLAATLQGLETLHASAVALDGSALAFLAVSGRGKTSVAAHLVARGAGLVADDVLTVETSSAGVLAHPGAGLVNIDPAELERLGEARAGFGETLGRSDKVHLAVPLVVGPRRVAALYFLRRGGAGKGARIVPQEGEEARALLGGTFLRYLRSPERLRTHLDVCARLAASVPAFDLLVPAGTPALEAAKAVERHADTLPTPAT